MDELTSRKPWGAPSHLATSSASESLVLHSTGRVSSGHWSGQVATAASTTAVMSIMGCLRKADGSTNLRVRIPAIEDQKEEEMEWRSADTGARSLHRQQNRSARRRARRGDASRGALNAVRAARRRDEFGEGRELRKVFARRGDRVAWGTAADTSYERKRAP